MARSTIVPRVLIVQRAAQVSNAVHVDRVLRAETANVSTWLALCIFFMHAEPETECALVRCTQPSRVDCPPGSVPRMR